MAECTGVNVGFVPDSRESEYLELLRSAHGGEVIGAKVFDALLATRFGADPERREVLRLLGGVEARTRDVLAAMLADAGVPVAGEEETPPLTAFDELVGAGDWTSLNESMLASLRDLARPVYERLRALAPDPAEARLATVLHHVDVVEAVLAGELAGRSDLEPARDYLA